MRRLPRIRGVAPAAAGLPTPAPFRPCTISPAVMTMARGTIPTKQSIPSQTRHLSTTSPRGASEMRPVRGVVTDLTLPPAALREAPRKDEVSDPTYTPAETLEELEEAGGLSSWWEDPSHWGATKRYVGFGPAPAERITDPLVLEVLVRRALVEVLAASQQPRKANAGAVSRAAATTLYGSGVAADAGEAAYGVSLSLGGKGEPVLSTEAAEDIFGKLKEVSKAEAGLVRLEVVNAEEASDLVKKWDEEKWKGAVLDNHEIKFHIAKRLQQLTGHIIPDHRLMSTTTVGGLLKLVVTPPKPKKLFEVVEAKGIFEELPNVKVFPRRVTPIDKEQRVGRWKVIAEELKRRELPVTGTGDYDKTVEKKWVMGER